MCTLVFHQGALGDSILIWPLLRSMGPVTWVGAGEKVGLCSRFLANVSAMDQHTMPWHLLWDTDLDLASLPGAMQEVLAGSSRTVSFIHGSTDRWLQQINRWMPHVEHHVVDPRPDRVHPTIGHVVHAMAEQLERSGCAVALDLGDLSLSDPSGPLVIHPGSGSIDKCWPADRFASLARRWSALGRAVCVVVGEVEQERMTPAAMTMLSAAAPLRICSDLQALAEILSGACIFLGNDSGPGHLAAQMGLPTVSLFGPSCPRHWSPLGRQVRILRAPGPVREMAGMSADQVWAVLNGIWDQAFQRSTRRSD